MQIVDLDATKLGATCAEYESVERTLEALKEAAELDLSAVTRGPGGAQTEAGAFL